ncbi:putative transcription factor AS2-LOB family protein [Tanacetum coccineum]
MTKSQDGETRLCLVDDLTVLKITSPLTRMERGFFSLKGRGVGRGVKEKHDTMVVESVEDVPPIIELVATEVQSLLMDKANVVNTGGGSYPPLPTKGTTSPGNTPTESIRAVSDRFANSAYGFFLEKRVAYPVFSSMDGLNSILENGPWFICNHPIILKKWNPYVNLLKEDVGNVPVWVKLHGVPVTAFSENGLSAIATKLDTPIMLDSYTADMCLQSWGRFLQDFNPMTSPRCAACKYFRRRCPSNCVFAPYFPNDNPQRFIFVHKIYGASNITKVIEETPMHLRADAMDSLYYEAKCRIQDPVYGCAGIISSLHQQIQIAQSQLAKAQAEIAILDANFALDAPRPRLGESLLQLNNGDDFGLDDIFCLEACMNALISGFFPVGFGRELDRSSDESKAGRNQTLIMEEEHATKYSVYLGENRCTMNSRYTNGGSNSMRKDIEVVLAEIGESKMIGLELEQETTKVVVIKERPKESKDRQES